MDTNGEVDSENALEHDCENMTALAARISRNSLGLVTKMERVTNEMRQLRIENERLLENEKDLLRVSTVVRVQKENDALKRELDEKRALNYESIQYKKNTYILEKSTGKVYHRNDDGSRGVYVGKYKVKITFHE